MEACQKFGIMIWLCFHVYGDSCKLEEGILVRDRAFVRSARARARLGSEGERLNKIGMTGFAFA